MSPVFPRCFTIGIVPASLPLCFPLYLHCSSDKVNLELAYDIGGIQDNIFPKASHLDDRHVEPYNNRQILAQ